MISSKWSTRLSLLFRCATTWRSHIPKARGNRRSDKSTQTLGTPKRPKRVGEREGAIVFEWIYMRVLLRISRFCSVTCAVPLPLLVIPPITCLSLPLSLLSVPLRITGVCQSPIREGCWVMGETDLPCCDPQGLTRLGYHAHTQNILTPKYKHAYVCAQRRWIYA